MMTALIKLSEVSFQASFSISERNQPLLRLSTTFRKEMRTTAFLVTIEKGNYLIPYRTQKSSPSSPMVLHARVWKSRASPVFFHEPQSNLRLFFFELFSFRKGIQGDEHEFT